MEIVKIATWDNRVDEQQALSLTKGKGMQIADARALQKITEDDSLWEQYKDCFPCRSSTTMSYKKGETEAIIQHPGEKPKKIKIPLNDGYYIVGEDGIPNGAKSSRSDKDAAHFWRWQDRGWSGLVARDYDFGYVRRFVFCGYYASYRYGVLGTKDKKHKHVWKTTCEVCGEKKK